MQIILMDLYTNSNTNCVYLLISVQSNLKFIKSKAEVGPCYDEQFSNLNYGIIGKSYYSLE